MTFLPWYFRWWMAYLKIIEKILNEQYCIKSYMSNWRNSSRSWTVRLHIVAFMSSGEIVQKMWIKQINKSFWVLSLRYIDDLISGFLVLDDLLLIPLIRWVEWIEAGAFLIFKERAVLVTIINLMFDLNIFYFRPQEFEFVAPGLCKEDLLFVGSGKIHKQ